MGAKVVAGAMSVLYGSAGGLSAARDQFWHQDSTGVRGTAEHFDNFGYAVTAGDFNNDGASDVAVGAPGESVNQVSDAGAVHALYGSAAGQDAANSQMWSQDRPGIKDAAETQDQFGFSPGTR